MLRSILHAPHISRRLHSPRSLITLVAAAAVIVTATTGGLLLGDAPVTAAEKTPQVVKVSSSVPDGTYTVGARIPITVVFDQPITVDLSSWTNGPFLVLATGDGFNKRARARYVWGTNSDDSITFLYTVRRGDHSLDLDVAVNRIRLNGAAIRASGTRVNANVTLPAPGTPGSLSDNKDIVIGGLKKLRPANLQLVRSYAGCPLHETNQKPRSCRSGVSRSCLDRISPAYSPRPLP